MRKKNELKIFTLQSRIYNIVLRLTAEPLIDLAAPEEEDFEILTDQIKEIYDLVKGEKLWSRL
jgi:hypothetical protein